MKNKLLAMVLSLTLILGLTACGQVNETEKSPEAPKETSAVVEESKTEEPAPEVKEDPTEIRVIMYGDVTPRKEEFFKNEFHEAVLEDINVDVTVEFLAWGSDNTEVPNRMMTGEKFAFMNLPTNNNFADRGLLAEISQEDIDAYMPEYLDMRGEKGFECAKVDGKIVGVPIGNKIVSGNWRGVTVLNNILNEVGWDYKDIKNLADLEEAVAAVREKYPDMRILRDSQDLLLAMDYEFGGDIINYRPTMNSVVYNDEDDKVTFWYETEDFIKSCKLAEKWKSLGYIDNDILSDPTAATNDWNVGNCLLYYGAPGHLVETGVKAGMPEGTELQIVTLGNENLTRYYDRDYDWAFSITSGAKDDVVSYLKFFNWLYASQENYEMAIYGLEGTDWERNADGTIKKLTTETFFDDWFLQALCYHTYDPSISEETIETYEHWDDGSKKAKLAGFSFDSTTVAAEAAAVKSVHEEFGRPLYEGFGNIDEDYEDLMKRFEEAGYKKYVEEYQRQYSAWYAENYK